MKRLLPKAAHSVGVLLRTHHEWAITGTDWEPWLRVAGELPKSHLSTPANCPWHNGDISVAAGSTQSGIKNVSNPTGFYSRITGNTVISNLAPGAIFCIFASSTQRLAHYFL